MEECLGPRVPAGVQCSVGRRGTGLTSDATQAPVTVAAELSGQYWPRPLLAALLGGSIDSATV
jgi:hypothetical protein